MNDDILHIINGDAAGSLLRAAGIGGEVLPWRDVLHDGPVPGGLDLDDLSDLRAAYLAERFGEPLETVRAQMTLRNTTLRQCGERSAVVLWFEHDLYDQLQILQVLDALAGVPKARGKVSMICIDRFEGHDPFHGLGELAPEEILSLWSLRAPTDEGAFVAAHGAWAAFTASEPEALNELPGDFPDLPFLGAAMARLKAEYPSLDNGLPQTERTMLDLAVGGVVDPVGLFIENQKRETAPFLGDWSFWWRLADLCAGDDPLIERTDGQPFVPPPFVGMNAAFKAQRFAVTGTGKAVWRNEMDAVALLGGRWIGGVRLTGARSDRRFDPGRGQLQGNSAT